MGGEAAPEAIERWETAGGAWIVVRVGERLATVDLLRCDGGETVERLNLTDPEDLRWAAAQLRGPSTRPGSGSAAL